MQFVLCHVCCNIDQKLRYWKHLLNTSDGGRVHVQQFFLFTYVQLKLGVPSILKVLFCFQRKIIRKNNYII